MSGIDVLRASSPARALGLAGSMADALAARGWSVTGPVVDPAVDVAARRTWSGRSDVRAHVHILVQIDTAAQRDLLFAAAPPPVPDETLPFYWIGEHDLGEKYQTGRERGEARIARAIAAAPPSRLIAQAWRDGNDLAHPAIDRAFASPAEAEAAFFRHDVEILEEDDELALVDASDLVAPFLRELHHFLPVVVTDSSMWSAQRDVVPVTRIRVVRRTLADPAHTWVDVIHTTAVDAYLDAVTTHFTSTYTRRRFQPSS